MTAAVLLDKGLLDRVISRMGRAQDAPRANEVARKRQCRLEVEDRIKTRVGESVSYDE